MKVAVLSESPADQAVVHILVNALLGQETELHDVRLTEGGWARVFKSLPGILKGLHYRGDVEALAVILDSDTSLPHVNEHDEPSKSQPKCRLCQLRAIVDSVESELRSKGALRVQTAIGLAMPCIEAWLLCGTIQGRGVTEAEWITGLMQNRPPYWCKDLKVRLHGTTHVAHQDLVGRMANEARRISANVGALESMFPNGFGPLAAAVRRWRLPERKPE